MEFKVVIADPETGRSYSREIKDKEATNLIGKRIGEEIEGEIFGLSGYKLKICGGSDKSGFPMKKGIHEPVERVLMSKGTGYKPKRDVRQRKRVRGEFITEKIVQINTKITARGSRKKIEEIFEIKEEVPEEKEKKTKEEVKEKPEEKEKKPAEKPKEQKKPEVEKKEEKPREEKPKRREPMKEESKEKAEVIEKEEKTGEKVKTEAKKPEEKEVKEKPESNKETEKKQSPEKEEKSEKPEK